MDYPGVITLIKSLSSETVLTLNVRHDLLYPIITWFSREEKQLSLYSDMLSTEPTGAEGLSFKSVQKKTSPQTESILMREVDRHGKMAFRFKQLNHRLGGYYFSSLNCPSPKTQSESLKIILNIYNPIFRNNHVRMLEKI